MKSKNKISVLIAGLLLVFFISNCKKQESPNPTGNGQPNQNPTVPPNPYTPPAITFSAPVMGFVEDVNGNPVEGAVVSTGSKTATTDANGAFEIAAAPFTGDFCYIKATKAGYFFGSNTVHGKSGLKFSTTLTMVPHGNAVTFKGSDAKIITLTGGASVNFPANAIKTLDGKAYTGNVNVVTTHLNPAAADFSKLIPGGDLRAYNAEGKDVQLYSYGMLGVELRDDAGNYLQLADGQKAALNMPVPAGMQSTAPATIPLWYFDENKGVWIEEGSAALKNGAYTGTVAHFTYWNCDFQGPRAKIKGKIKDCENEAASNLMANVGNAHGEINETGDFERQVPANLDNLELKIYSSKDYYNSLTTKPIPRLKEGEMYDVGTLTITCPAKLKGNITDCDNKPFDGYVIVKTISQTIRGTIANGVLKLIVPASGEPAEVYFHKSGVGQLSKVNTTLPATKTTVDLGNVKACPLKTVPMLFSFDYNDGSTTKSVSFNNISQSKGVYKTSKNIMEFSFQNQGTEAGNAYFQIKTPKVGSFPASTDNHINVGIYSTNSYKSFFSNEGTYLTSYNVLKYESVTGEVSGTFSGTMYMIDSTGGSGSSKMVTVTNGKFSTVRHPDE